MSALDLKDNRIFNPAGYDDQASFAEMVEDTWAGRGRLKQLFDRVAKHWPGFGPGELTALFADRLEPEVLAKRRANDSSLFTAEKPALGHMAINVMALDSAFALADQSSLKLWRLASGDDINWARCEILMGQLEQNPKDQKARHALTNTLYQNSGMPNSYYARACGVSDAVAQQWRTGRTKIANLDHARKVVDFYVPDFLSSPEGFKTRLTAVLTGRTDLGDLDSVIEKAKNSDDPVMDLGKALFSKQSITGLSVNDAAKVLKIEPRMVHQRIEGIVRFNEPEARKLAKLVGATSTQTEDIVTILTGIAPSPELMMLVKAKPNRFLEIALKMRERKGLTLEDIRKKIGASELNVGKLELGEPMYPKHAKAVANLYFTRAERATEEYQMFISCASGLGPHSASEVLIWLNQNAIDPERGLMHLVTIRGQAWNTFCKANGISHAIMDDVRSGTLSPRMRERLGKVFNCTPDNFLGASVNYRPGLKSRAAKEAARLSPDL